MRSKTLATLSILVGLALLCWTFVLVLDISSAGTTQEWEGDIEKNIASVDRHPEATPTPSGQEYTGKFPTPTPSPTPEPEVKQTAFEWSWPKELNTQDEGTVSLSAVTVSEGTLPPLDASPHEGTGSEQGSIGLAHTPLASAFGPGYTATATASLDAPSFKKTPEGEVAKVLDEGDANWEWIVTPQSEGAKVMTVRMKVEWVGLDQSHPMKRREWFKTLKTEVKKPVVKKPWVTLGTFELLPWLTGISGTSLLGFAAFIFGKGKFGKKDNEGEGS